jgi:hypothetical protein
MSNVSALAIFILVLSPLLIPLTITGVHAIAEWRRSLRTALKNTRPKSAPSPVIDGGSMAAL